MDKALKSVLEWWDNAGVDTPDIPAGKAARSAPVKQQEKTPTAGRAQSRNKPPEPEKSTPQLSELARLAAPLAAKAKTLAQLKTTMEGFDAGALSDQARQCVFARGNPESDLMIIGEAPGRDEDIAGKPFIGPAGQLLDRMLASIGLNEEQFYITNVVNWRLPKNRSPKAEEINMCRPFLDRHIELMAPKIILLVGGVSLSAMTGQTGIMKMRGQWQTLDIGKVSFPALPLYHPAFLMRQPALKKDAWHDLLSLKAKLESA